MVFQQCKAEAIPINGQSQGDKECVFPREQVETFQQKIFTI